MTELPAAPLFYPKALYGIGKVLDRLNRPDEATAMYRRSREMTGR